MRRTLVAIAVLVLLAASSPAKAASPTLAWKQRQWRITTGGMAGVADGDPANVTVDKKGYLHIRIVKRNTTTTAAELFTQDHLGFGTYQWQLDGPVDRMDPSTVLGLFPYGPIDGIGTDGENEIDIEFSQWNGCDCNADFNIYPATGQRKVGPTGKDFTVNLKGKRLTTARFTWTSTNISEVIMRGLQPLGVTKNVLASWTFAPPNPSVRIPQVALPVGMNLWCFQQCPATDQEVIVRDFQFAAA